MPQIIISMLCFKTLSGLKSVLPMFNQSSNSTKINHRLMLKAYVENSKNLVEKEAKKWLAL